MLLQVTIEESGHRGGELPGGPEVPPRGPMLPDTPHAGLASLWAMLSWFFPAFCKLQFMGCLTTGNLLVVFSVCQTSSAGRPLFWKQAGDIWGRTTYLQGWAFSRIWCPHCLLQHCPRVKATNSRLYGAYPD